MAMNRREFMGTAAAVGAGCLVHSSGVGAEAAALGNIGVQLYTVRTEMEKSVEATLARVAAIGYKEVEFAGYFNRSPAALRDALKQNGLTAPAAHIDYNSLSDANLPKAIEAAVTMGHTFLVNPWIDETMRKEPDIWARVAQTFNRAGEQCRKAGIQFAYHNHNFEFAAVSGRMPFDILLEQCDAALVKMELDLFWVQGSGLDPVDYFKKYPGRFPLVHVKDLTKVPARASAAKVALPIDDLKRDMTEVGKGAIDWKRLLAAAGPAGVRHYFVEHDAPAAPFDSISESYRYPEGTHLLRLNVVMW